MKYYIFRTYDYYNGDLIVYTSDNPIDLENYSGRIYEFTDPMEWLKALENERDKEYQYLIFHPD